MDPDKIQSKGLLLSGVRVVTETQDPEQLKADVQSLSIGGGGEEEVLSGERCQGVRGSMYLDQT